MAGKNSTDSSIFHPLCFAAKTERTSNGAYKVYSSSSSDPDISVTTVHLSCSSHVYNEDSDYAGFILYSYNRMTDWRLNGVHCLTGYIVVQDTNSPGVKACSKASGVVHGAVYMNVFGQDVDSGVVGEGFAQFSGESAPRWNSGTFNAKADNYHDGKRGISDEGKKCVTEVLKEWKAAGLNYHCLSSCRTWNVAELLKR